MDFRSFCYNMWMAHKDELIEWEKRLPEYDSSEYFKRYKWMLKSMYRQTDGNLDFLEKIK